MNSLPTTLGWGNSCDRSTLNYVGNRSMDSSFSKVPHSKASQPLSHCFVAWITGRDSRHTFGAWTKGDERVAVTLARKRSKTFAYFKKQPAPRASRTAGACFFNPVRQRRAVNKAIASKSACGDRRTKLGWAAAEADFPPDLASGSVAVPVSGTAPLPPLSL